MIDDNLNLVLQENENVPDANNEHMDLDIPAAESSSEHDGIDDEDEVNREDQCVRNEDCDDTESHASFPNIEESSDYYDVQSDDEEGIDSENDNEVSDGEEVPFLDMTVEDLALPLAFNRSITAKDHLLATLACSIRFLMSYEATLSMLKWIGHTWQDSGLPTTKRALWKMLCKNDSLCKRTLYCRICQDCIGQGTEITRVCQCGESGPRKKKEVSFFINVSLKAQLKHLLKIPNMANSLSYRFRRQKRNETALEDIYDSAEYKKLCEPGKFLSNPYNFTYTFNTDGCQVSKSSNSSAWPIFVQLNELHPHARKRHIMLAGIWVDVNHPILDTIMKPFIDEANELLTSGISWNVNNNEVVISKFKPIICTMDSMARKDALAMTQFNGKFGCTFCYRTGVNLRRTGGHMVYPFQDIPAPRRTDGEIRQDMILAARLQERVHGVKRPSIMALLLDFDLSKGFVVDSMHNVYLGVIKRITDLILNGAASNTWYVGSPRNMALIDHRLLQCKPPTRISRLPRSVKYLKLWKASEWRNWLLYYCLPCLDGIVQNKYLENLALLSEASYILNSDSILVTDMEKAKGLLLEFAQGYEELYGLGNMTYNIHLLSHLAESVENWGPFWVHSCFPFESMNRKIIDTITSPNSMELQVVTRFLMTKFVQSITYDTTVHPDTKAYINRLISNKSDYYNLNDAEYAEVSFNGLGKCVRRQPLDWENAALQQYDCMNTPVLSCYKKARMAGIEYRCRTEKLSTKFCNSYVCYDTNNFGEIIGIVEFCVRNNPVNGVFLKSLHHVEYAYETEYIHTVVNTKNIVFITTGQIAGPAIAVFSATGSQLMMKLPNVWESD